MKYLILLQVLIASTAFAQSNAPITSVLEPGFASAVTTLDKKVAHGKMDDGSDCYFTIRKANYSQYKIKPYVGEFRSVETCETANLIISTAPLSQRFLELSANGIENWLDFNLDSDDMPETARDLAEMPGKVMHVMIGTEPCLNSPPQTIVLNQGRQEIKGSQQILMFSNSAKVSFDVDTKKLKSAEIRYKASSKTESPILPGLFRKTKSFRCVVNPISF